jgi:cytochrome c553
MGELGKALLGTAVIALFFGFTIYPNLEYSGVSRVQACTDECYEEYVALNGTTVEIEQRKQALAATDAFSGIRSLWAGCAACHGADGGGGVGPMLASEQLQTGTRGKKKGRAHRVKAFIRVHDKK